KLNRSPLSRTFDLKAPVVEVTVCGMSSALVQVTVVPGFTVTTWSLKVKLAIWTAAAEAGAGAARTISATTVISMVHATRTEAWNDNSLKARGTMFSLVGTSGRQG